MPWLIKGNEKLSENLLFIHVPRCGGTSLIKSHNVPQKVMKNRSLWGRIGMKIFFHRYKMLEEVNFPIYTRGNGACVLIFVSSMVNQLHSPQDENKHIYIFLMLASASLFLGLSFVFTAPTIGRITYIRRAFLVLVHYILLRFMESTAWLVGTNMTGYINHLTASKMLRYKYVTPEEMEHCASMAIVRNPYSRMVSIYMYNRFGPYENFEHFCRSWCNMMKSYKESGETEEWFTPCHGLPQCEYTHVGNRQLVQSIIKQEELKFLKYKQDEHLAIEQDSSVSNLPDVVREALLEMPHSNKRVTKVPWWDYYDQETLDLTYELYAKDFETFHYSPILDKRPDLQSPQVSYDVKEEKLDQSQRNSLLLSKRDKFIRSSLISSASKRHLDADAIAALESDVSEDEDFIDRTYSKSL